MHEYQSWQGKILSQEFDRISTVEEVSQTVLNLWTKIEDNNIECVTGGQPIIKILSCQKYFYNSQPNWSHVINYKI